MKSALLRFIGAGFSDRVTLPRRLRRVQDAHASKKSRSRHENALARLNAAVHVAVPLLDDLAGTPLDPHPLTAR